MASPGRGSTRPGLSFAAQHFGKRTCKPNSVVCGHSSRRRVAADAHQRPTRRFRQLHEALQRRRPVAADPARAAWAHRADAQLEPGSFAPASLPIWSCSVWGLPCPRLYSRSCALLPHHFSLTPAPSQQADSGRPSPVPKKRGGEAEAGSFLWHWPSMSFEAHVPDVIRHTALRSSDFPPPAVQGSRPAAGSDRPVPLPVVSLSRIAYGSSSHTLLPLY